MSERKLADSQLTYRAMTPTFTERRHATVKEQNFMEAPRKSSLDMRLWKAERRVYPQFSPLSLHRKNTPRYLHEVNFTPPKRPFQEEV